jgi:hypothetical protein
MATLQEPQHESIGDRQVLPALTYRELLVLAYAFGGADAPQAVNEAERTIVMLDNRGNAPLKFGALSVHRRKEEQ